MVVRQLIVAQLFERNRSRLQLNWICGTLNRAITITRDDISPADLVGHLNLIHPDRLQVLGSPEDFLGRAGKRRNASPTTCARSSPPSRRP